MQAITLFHKAEEPQLLMLARWTTALPYLLNAHLSSLHIDEALQVSFDDFCLFHAVLSEPVMLHRHLLHAVLRSTLHCWHQGQQAAAAQVADMLIFIR